MYLRNLVTNLSYAMMSLKSFFYFTINGIFPWFYIHDGPDIIFLMYYDIRDKLFSDSTDKKSL